MDIVRRLQRATTISHSCYGLRTTSAASRGLAIVLRTPYELRRSRGSVGSLARGHGGQSPASGSKTAALFTKSNASARREFATTVKLEVARDPHPARAGGRFCDLFHAYGFVAKRSRAKNFVRSIDSDSSTVARSTRLRDPFPGMQSMRRGVAGDDTCCAVDPESIAERSQARARGPEPQARVDQAGLELADP